MRFSKDEIRRSMLLYAITDRRWLQEDESLTAVCRRVLENGATFLQIREKDLDEADFTAEAAALKALCKEYRVPFVVNDSVEIALALEADGAHVGQSDIRGRNLRALLGEGRILGISAGNIDEAIAAEKAGADYIGVGAVFSTGTKEDARCIPHEELRRICAAVSIPVVAIGGITEKNMGDLCGSGACGAAVVSAIFAASDPGAATAALRRRAEEVFGG